MQKKILSTFLPIIPKELSGFQLKIYTQIFEHFLEIGDYVSFQSALV